MPEYFDDVVSFLQESDLQLPFANHFVTGNLFSGPRYVQMSCPSQMFLDSPTVPTDFHFFLLPIYVF